MSDSSIETKDTEKDTVKSNETPVTLVAWSTRMNLPYNSVIQICRKHSVKVFRFAGQSRAYERDLDRAFQTELSKQIERLDVNSKLRKDRLSLKKTEKEILQELKRIKDEETLTNQYAKAAREKLATTIAGLPNESMLKDLQVST
jgi:hypothetical protein